MQNKIVAVIVVLGIICLIAAINYTINTKTQIITSRNTINGLNLTLTINSTMIPQNGNISIDLKLVNTLDSYNNVTAENDWLDVKGLYGLPSVCASIDFPIELSLFKGYYTQVNISSANPLLTPTWTTKPFSMPTCPIPVFHKLSGYRFNPLSDKATIFGTSYSPIVQSNTISALSSNVPIAYNIDAVGYWINSSIFGVTAQNFTTGTYTLVGADEWNQTAIVHFNVTGAIAIQSSNSSVYNDFNLSMNVNTTSAAPIAIAKLFYNGSKGYAMNTSKTEGNFYTYVGYASPDTLNCNGYPYSTLGIRLYSGYYNQSTITSASPLGLYNDTMLYLPCVVMIRTLGHVGLFNPKSYNVTLTQVAPNYTNQSSNSQQKLALNLTGYWSTIRNNYTFHTLQPGTYTAEAVDIFNQTAIAHFIVRYPPPGT
jgi:hypothetical protein